MKQEYEKEVKVKIEALSQSSPEKKWTQIPWSQEEKKIQRNDKFDLEMILYKTFLKRGDIDALYSLFPNDAKREKLECRLVEFQDATGLEVPSVDDSLSVFNEVKETQRKTRRVNPIHGLEPTEYTLNMITYKYLLDQGNDEALKMIYPDEEWRRLYKKDLKRHRWPELTEMTRHLKLYRERLALGPVNSSERSWECQECKQIRKGPSNVLCRHISLHRPTEFPCECVIEGCGRIFSNPFTAREHLVREHEKPVGKLDQEEFDRMKRMSWQFLEVMTKHLLTYFPPESFRGFSQYDYRQRNASAVCKQCNQKIRKLERCRKEHIASHLNLSYLCIMDDCFKSFPDPWRLTSHYAAVHKITNKKMTAEQSIAHRDMKKKFNEAVNKVFADFFDLSGGNPKEGEDE